jgi:hypothetical protein
MNERTTGDAIGLGELSAADLHALRLATQVFRHRAQMLAKPALDRYWADLGRAVDFELARHGVGFVLGQAPDVQLDETADADDRQLLAEQLGLLAGNDQLAPAVRALCSTLRSRIVATVEVGE